MTVDMPQRIESDLSALAVPSEELIIKEARRRHRRRILAIAGVTTLMIAGMTIAAVAMAGHGSTSKQSSPLPTRPGQLPVIAQSRCQYRQLRVTALSGGAGAGSRQEIVGFFNVSNTSCTVTGYPVVVALDAQGAQVATAEPDPYSGSGGGNTGAGPSTVELKPGQFAAAILYGRGIPLGTATSCSQYDAFLVTPPNQTQSVRVAAWSGWEPGPFPGCSGIAVGPFVPGTRSDYPLSPTPFRPDGGKPVATIPSRGMSATTTTP
jgi:hypothetical protein